MDMATPHKTREYDKHPELNGKRWAAYRHRMDDIVISTSYKSGTTWMQTIVANLIFQDGKFPEPVSMMSPWFEMDLIPLDDILNGLEAQKHRRFIKTHLPLDGLPYFDTMKYIYVSRDGRDVFMSLWNHINGFADEVKEEFAEIAKSQGKELSLDYKDLHELWDEWISKSWYDWENDGYPYWSHFHNLETWWKHRNLPNIHFVHFSDLLKDPVTAVRKIAAFLDLEINEDLLPGIMERISFGSMKKNFMNIMPESAEIWKEGGDRFMNKGTNGRWRGVLSDAELRQYDAAVKRTLTKEAAHWLEHGGDI